MSLQRRRYLFHGQVQGVGFRYTTQRLAAGHDLAGYARNLPDGSVEVVAEGQAGELDRFLEALKQTFSGQVRQLDRIDETPGFEPLGDFSIRF